MNLTTIKVLTHIATRTVDYPEISDSVESALEVLLNTGMIKDTTTTKNYSYIVTNKGRCWLDYIQLLELPTEQFSMD